MRILGDDALTRSMALDLAPYGIRVDAVAQGATRIKDAVTPKQQSFRE